MQEESGRSFRLVSYHDDQPVERPGALIPRKTAPVKTTANFHPFGVKESFNIAPIVGAGFGALAVFMLAIVATAGYGLVAQNNLASAPTVTIVDPYTLERSQLGYSPQPALELNNFFIETRDAFIDESATFIEVDVAAEQLRYFKRGVLLQSAEIQSIGKEGSWWSVPAGLYEVESLEEKPYSNLAQVYMPNAVRFGGNYLIHGTPTYPDGSDVPTDAGVGGIRLTDESAEQLYRLAAEGISVLVHTPPVKPDSFVYQPVVSNVNAAQYLVADLDNGTILAAKGMTEVVPIASLVKLMTAVVAAEEIDLDTRVWATAPSFVESLIPRLADRRSVSVYSLLQLLLVESSNEAAEVIADQIGRDDFIARMNEKALQIGMYDTTFVDPSGVHAGNESTVNDLYLLMRYINNHRSFIFDITDTTRVTTDYVGGEFGNLVNFNQIEDVDNLIGGKVGETTTARQTSVTLHELPIQNQSRSVVIVVLGSDDRASDVQALLDHVEKNYSN